MWRGSLLAFALAAVTLSGCIGEPQGGVVAGPAAVVAFELAGVPSANEAVLFEGKRLVGKPADATTSMPPFLPPPESDPCGAENCERVTLEIHDTGGRDVGIMLEWEGQDETWSTTGGPGYYLGDVALHMDGTVWRDGDQVLDLEESFHYGSVGILAAPEPGTYEVQVVANKGVGTYYLTVRVQDPEPFVAYARDGELLPDLVAIPPDHPTFRMPFGHEAENPGGATAAGCGPDEAAEDRDLRCLRFAGIIGNQGPGDFLTVLEYDQAQASLAGGLGHWEQVIRHVDGSERRVRIGPADYHEVHGHFHILDFVATQLYAYDPETKERGEAVGEGRKMGFCIIDGGLIDTLGLVVPPKYHGNGCCYIVGICQLDMLAHERFQMGMSPNWYDIYPWWRSDQYTEVSGLADGVYELVTVINPDGLIVESDMDNNEASTVLRISGDQVEVLDMQTQAHMGPHPDADWGYAAQQAADSG